MTQKFIIIEDDETKARAMTDLLESVFGLSNIPIARSYQSGVKQLKKNTYDLILLDMTMDTFDIGKNKSGGKPQAFAGKHVLDQMDRYDILTPVIVVTGFETFGKGAEMLNLEQLDNQLKKSYPKIYMGKIYYHASEASWKDRLSTKIRKLFPEMNK